MGKWRYLLFAILPPLFLTGCWDRKDPEDRAFIITLGVDLAEEGCRFTFAPANIETGEAETYGAEARTLAEAVAQVDCRSSRKTDLGQLKTIIFSEKLLENQAQRNALLEELERSQTVSEKVMLLATEDAAADCVDAAMAEDSKTGLFLWDFYKNTAQEVAVTKGMDLDTFLTEMQEQGGCGVFPRIRVEDEKLRLGGGIAVSPTGVYSLEDEEERGYLFLLGEAEGALLEGEYMGEMIPLEIGKSKVKYDFTKQGDGSILCTVTLPLEGTLQGGGGVFLSEQSQQSMETLFEGIIKEEIQHTMRIAEMAGEDLFGVLPKLYQSAPQISAEHSRETLWQALEFEFCPELKLKDMGRKR